VSKLQVALDFARRGYEVFRLGVNSKYPLPGSHGHLDATSDETTIRSWWTGALGEALDYNVGLRIPSGVVLIDLDQKKGRNGIGEFLALGGVLDGLVVRTPTNGYHVFATGPDSQNTQGTIAPGVDSRGQDGYGVAPGSTIDGVPYEIVSDNPLLPVPEAILSRLPPRRIRTASVTTHNVDDDLPANIERFRQACERAPGSVSGSWHADTLRLVAEAVRLAISCETATEIMLEVWVPKGTGFYEDGRNERWPGDVSASYDWAMRQGEHGMHSADAAYITFSGINVTVPEEDVAEKPQLRIMYSRSWAEGLAKRAEPVPYLIKGLVGPGDQMAVLGGPGCGKSVLLPYLAFCVATGTPFLERKVKQARVLYFATENGEGLERRLQVLGDRMGDPGEFLRVFPLPMNLSANSEDCEAFANTLNYWQPGLVIIDTLFAGFPETDLTDRGEFGINYVVKASKAFTNRESRPVVAYGHHTPKSGEDAYGGQQLQAMFDTTLFVKGSLKEDRTVTVRKNRMGPDGDDYTFRIASAPVCVDEEGDTITAPIIEWVETRSEEERSQAENDKWLAEVTTGARNVLDMLRRSTEFEVKEGRGCSLADQLGGGPKARISRESLCDDLVAFGLLEPTATPAVRNRVADKFLSDLKKHGFVDYDSTNVWITRQS